VIAVRPSLHDDHNGDACHDGGRPCGEARDAVLSNPSGPDSEASRNPSNQP
jgi:hypothetical protein